MYKVVWYKLCSQAQHDTQCGLCNQSPRGVGLLFHSLFVAHWLDACVLVFPSVNERIASLNLQVGRWALTGVYVPYGHLWYSDFWFYLAGMLEGGLAGDSFIFLF